LSKAAANLIPREVFEAAVKLYPRVSALLNEYDLSPEQLYTLVYTYTAGRNYDSTRIILRSELRDALRNLPAFRNETSVTRFITDAMVKTGFLNIQDSEKTREIFKDRDGQMTVCLLTADRHLVY
jgi:hypothetical protein